MWSFLLSDANLIFTTALALVLALALFQIVGMLIGISVFGDVDADADIDLSTGVIPQFVGWLGLNRVPVLVWLMFYAFGLGVIGLAVNLICQAFFAFTPPVFISLSIAIGGSLVCAKVIARQVALYLPQVQTSAVSHSSFEGAIAQITVGSASYRNPAEAFVTDKHQQKHYLLVAPMDDQHTFTQGDKVILVRRQTAYWEVIPYTNV